MNNEGNMPGPVRRAAFKKKPENNAVEMCKKNADGTWTPLNSASRYHENQDFFRPTDVSPTAKAKQDKEAGFYQRLHKNNQKKKKKKAEQKRREREKASRQGEGVHGAGFFSPVLSLFGLSYRDGRVADVTPRTQQQEMHPAVQAAWQAVQDLTQRQEAEKQELEERQAAEREAMRESHAGEMAKAQQELDRLEQAGHGKLQLRSSALNATTT